MKRFGRLIALVLMTAVLLVPGFGGTASAQDASWCTEAASMGAGSELYGYTVVYGSGGAGSQIVLSDGSGYLSGGSGNDILCAWGGGNTLDGGSGNDILVAMDGSGNELYGGSGNDTLIGLENNYFDGGSGRNTEQQMPPPIPTIALGGPTQLGVYFLTGTGFEPGAALLIFEVFSGMYNGLEVTVADDGSFSLEQVSSYGCSGSVPFLLDVMVNQGGETILTDQFSVPCNL